MAQAFAVAFNQARGMRGGRGSARGAATIDNNGVERAGPITTTALRVSPWHASCSTGNLIGLVKDCFTSDNL
ncbi:hypothetical protein M752DRAFT_274044, partial [Aspergillus phoenicis ATCC 13157]